MIGMLVELCQLDVTVKKQHLAKALGVINVDDLKRRFNVRHHPLDLNLARELVASNGEGQVG